MRHSSRPGPGLTLDNLADGGLHGTPLQVPHHCVGDPGEVAHVPAPHATCCPGSEGQHEGSCQAWALPAACDPLLMASPALGGAAPTPCTDQKTGSKPAPLPCTQTPAVPVPRPSQHGPGPTAQGNAQSSSRRRGKEHTWLQGDKDGTGPEHRLQPWIGGLPPSLNSRCGSARPGFCPPSPAMLP